MKLTKKILYIFYSNPNNEKTTRQDKQHEQPENMNCAICMEEIGNNNVCKLTCGHYYCLDCIIELKKHSNKCPSCRRIVFKNNNLKSKNINATMNIPSAPPAPTLPPPALITVRRVQNNRPNIQQPYTFEQYDSEVTQEVLSFREMFLS
ncbi:MAG: hypothetical protein CMG60_08115 [Candidatus Marinimicrobia bacterium]|nr:hypothetical protein [Candidatus Neomarinimicrobiota bacterium]